MGGIRGLTNGWPFGATITRSITIARSSTRSFLKASRTTAGYDPSFMAGYAKSVVFPSSSTLPELVVAVFGGEHPEFAYKVYVLVSAAAVPWLIALACAFWRIPADGAAIAVLLDLLYIWTDFPINYAGFGMLPYFLAIPLGLVATGAFARFLARGGAINWLVTTASDEPGVSGSFHHGHGDRSRRPRCPTSPRWCTRSRPTTARRRPRREMPPRRGRTRARSKPTAFGHVAVWMIPLIVLAVNAFWWLPGFWLACTKGSSDFVFSHPEG